MWSAADRVRFLNMVCNGLWRFDNSGRMGTGVRKVSPGSCRSSDTPVAVLSKARLPEAVPYIWKGLLYA